MWLNVSYQLPAFMLFALAGYPLLRATGYSRLTSAAISPTLSAALYLPAAIALNAAGIPWGRLSANTLLLALLVAGSFAVIRKNKKTPPKTRYTKKTLATLTLYLATWLASLSFLALPLLVNASPGLPNDQWDPRYHQAAVWNILDTGNASVLTSMQAMYPGASAPYYPNTWHQMIAAISSPSTITATATLSTIFIAGIWILGMGALARQVWIKNRLAVISVMLLSGAGLAFPIEPLTSHAQWPYLMAISLTPAAIAATLEFARRTRAITPLAQGAPAPARTLLTPGLTLATALIGLAAVHPLSVFNYAVLIGPLALAGAVLLLAAAIRKGAKKWVWGIGAALAGVLGAGAMLASTELFATVMKVGNEAYDMGRGLAAFITPYSKFNGSPAVDHSHAVYGVLSLIGFTRWILDVRAGKNRSLTQLALPALVALTGLLSMLAAGPQNPWRALTGPWFSDPRRLYALQAIPHYLLAGLGLAATATLLGAGVRKLRKRGAPSTNSNPTLAPLVAMFTTFALLTVITHGWGSDEREITIRRAYWPERSVDNYSLPERPGLQMMREIGPTLPPDTLILGDPLTGTSYWQIVGQTRVYYPQLSLAGSLGAPNMYLFAHLREIHENPGVCAEIKRLGITHISWINPAKTELEYPEYTFKNRANALPGFYKTNLSRGFTKVASGGPVELYRIDACK